ncbi:MAG: Maf family protein [Bacteroidia bacterium]|nr:Maf family protein [Bacteroidia bacterium]GIV23154.1 MAG: Maf-like protein [Bacteroidia bacterium]
MKIVLASASPRRKALLSLLPWPVEVRPTHVPEDGLDHLSPAQQAMALAARKVSPLLPTLLQEEVAIAADTLVILEGTRLGKPQTSEEAEQFLRRLSGRWHTVYTGVAVATTRHLWTFYEETGVRFRPLPDALIKVYIETGSSMDKAGGYGAQDLIGVAGIEQIIGDFYTVMGLPVQKLTLFLERLFGADLYKSA